MKFSVIIPTYNRKELLIKCLTELEKQTFKDFEVIVIDDGSNDGSDYINFKSFNLKLIYKKISNSGGPARPRNVGISIAAGEFICLLDVDDYWFKNKLEKCTNFLNSKVDVLYHDMLIINEHDQKVGHFKGRHLSSKNITFDLFRSFNPICNSSVIIRKEILNENIKFNEDSNFHFIEDFELWIKISYITNNFFYLDETLGVYFSHSTNNSNDLASQSLKIKMLYSKYISTFPINQQNVILGSLNYYLGCQNDKIINSEKRISIKYYTESLLLSHFKIKIKSLFKIIRISICLIYAR
jgi:glycosyltransferase involved in cell wall biosynthesis